jgi:CRISPR/Cas system-associated protein Csx1
MCQVRIALSPLQVRYVYIGTVSVHQSSSLIAVREVLGPQYHVLLPVLSTDASIVLGEYQEDRGVSYEQ